MNWMVVMTSPPLRVLVAEDEELIREALCLLVDSFDGYEVVGRAADGGQALELVKESEPDLVLMDLIMPGLNGVGAAKAIKAEYPRIKVLALTAKREDPYIFEALKAGVDGYALKNISGQELQRAMETVQCGNMYLCPDISEKIVAGYLMGRDRGPGSPLEALSPRESEVLTLIAAGFLTKQIATKLGISEKTVEKHRKNLKKKLGVNSTAGLVVMKIKYDPKE